MVTGIILVHLTRNRAGITPTLSLQSLYRTTVGK